MDDWRRYDDVATIYERVHAPRFALPARDLVEIAGVAAGQRVLDVGTGTGVAAEAARAAGAGSVAGIDPSMGMLRIARTRRPELAVAAAEAIDLPFAAGVFDAVLANFVLAHFTKYQTALADVVRVLRTGGRIAMSAWADPQDDLTRTWIELVEQVVPREVLEPSLSQAVPWRERFRDRAAIEEALLDAGLRHVRSEVRPYRFQYALDEYVEGLQTWATGRFVRSMLGEAAFASFVERAKVVFHERFADPINDFRDVMFVTGVKQ
jgi:ubiquinone/menaquinone biosynthesis C-methylase UbiE